MLKAMHKEIDLRHNFLSSPTIQTIYFGGGTPSLLSAEELKSILDHLKDYFLIDPTLECTLEANPEDLTPIYLDQLRGIGINRLSIGIQSFHEDDMKYMHRTHTPRQSIDAIEHAIRADIRNLSIDLIYGAPSTSLDHWKKNLEITFGLAIAHISCYALTVEPKTLLTHQIQKDKVPGPVDEDTIQQLEYLIEISPSFGFEQYEISNFSKQGHRSKHNSNYWLGAPYLGLGPAAHSFDGLSRQWNIAHNAQYLKAMEESLPYFETETLTEAMKYNEFILTRLRTIEGIPTNLIKEPFYVHLLSQSSKWITQDLLMMHQGNLKLTRQGKYIADRISADLFY
jgi:oxygen-independent coproporphyrinogen-3 oxidase